MNKKLINKKVKGKLVSPKLQSNIKNFLIDVDGTICDDVPNEEPERMVTAEHYPDALETINNWFNEGHFITFFTSRTEAHRKITEKWLEEKGFNYHNLLLGKPRGGNYYWIDNHPVNTVHFTGKFTELVPYNSSKEVFKK